MQPPINLRNLRAVNARLRRLALDVLLRVLDVDNAVDDRVRDVHAARPEFFGEADGQGSQGEFVRREGRHLRVGFHAGGGAGED